MTFSGRISDLPYYLSPCSGIELSDQLHAYKEMRHVPTIMLSDRRPHKVREINKRGLLSLGRPFELTDLLACSARCRIPRAVADVSPTPGGEVERCSLSFCLDPGALLEVVEWLALLADELLHSSTPHASNSEMAHAPPT